MKRAPAKRSPRSRTGSSKTGRSKAGRSGGREIESARCAGSSPVFLPPLLHVERFVLMKYLFAIIAIGAAGAAWAQAPAYPSKPIRIVIALAPGGGVDTTGRFVGAKLSQAWGQPVVADNRPGAGGAVASEIV